MRDEGRARISWCFTYLMIINTILSDEINRSKNCRNHVPEPTGSAIHSGNRILHLDGSLGPTCLLSQGILRGYVFCFLNWPRQGIRASATELTASGHLGFHPLFFYTWTVMVRRVPSLRLWRDHNVAVWCSRTRADLQGGHRSSPGSSPRKELRNPITLPPMCGPQKRGPGTITRRVRQAMAPRSPLDLRVT